MAQRRPYLDRDWYAFAATHAPDVVIHDHRLLGWGTLHGVEALLRTQQVLVELAPDTRLRDNHVITSEHGFLVSALLFGTRDGGAFELAFLRVEEINAAGKIYRIDRYDVDKVDDALARFAELDAKTPRDPLAALATPNAATAAMDRYYAAYDAAFATGDWDPVRETCTPEFILDDRRRFAQLRGDRELLIAAARERVAMGARAQRLRVSAAPAIASPSSACCGPAVRPMAASRSSTST
jgi:hypothetical protein